MQDEAAALFGRGLHSSLRWRLHTLIGADCLYFPANKVFGGQSLVLPEILVSREIEHLPSKSPSDGYAPRGGCCATHSEAPGFTTYGLAVILFQVSS